MLVPVGAACMYMYSACMLRPQKKLGDNLQFCVVGVCE